MGEAVHMWDIDIMVPDPNFAMKLIFLKKKSFKKENPGDCSNFFLSWTMIYFYFYLLARLL